MENRSWGICMVDRLYFNQIRIHDTSHLLKRISWGLPSWLSVLTRHRGQILCYWKHIPVKSKLIMLLQFRNLFTQFHVIWHWNFMTLFFSQQLSHWTKVTESCLNVYAKLAAEAGLCHSFCYKSHRHYCSTTRAVTTIITTETVTNTRALSLLLKKDGSWWY